MLFKLSAHLGTSVLVDQQNSASTILQENARLVAQYAGVDLEPDRAEEHEFIQRLRERSRERLRRRGVDPTQASAEVTLTVVDHDAVGPVLDLDLVRGSFAAEVDKVRRLEDQPGYENIELLSYGEFVVPPSERVPVWHVAKFRYRAIYRSGDVDPNDRILCLAVTSVGNVLTSVRYQYSYLLPAQPAFSALSLFLFEWRYSIVRAIEGRPPIPTEGDAGDPYWSRAERELRTMPPPAMRELADDAGRGHDRFELLGLGSEPDPEYSPPETDAQALAEAYYPDLRNPQRYTTHHEMAHALEGALAREMKLELDP